MVFFTLTLYYAQKVYPIPYEMKRIILMLIVAAGLYGISIIFNSMALVPRLAIKSIVILSYPFVLYLFRFYEPVEMNMIKGGWVKWSNPAAFRENIQRLINK